MTEEWMDDAWSDSEACPPEWMLSFYTDRELEGEDRRRAESHLVHCVACRERVLALDFEAGALRAALSLEERPEPARVRVTAAESTATGAGATIAASATSLVVLGGLFASPWPAALAWLNPLEGRNLFGLFFDVLEAFRNEGPALFQLTIASIALLSTAFLMTTCLTLILRRIQRQTGAALVLVLGIMGLSAVAPSPSSALELFFERESLELPAGEIVENTWITAADSVRIDGTLRGDLVAFGDRVVITGTVEGNVISGARRVEISGHVTGSTLTFGDRVQITGSIDHGAYSAAGQTTLGESGRIGGSFVALGDGLLAAGIVERDLFAYLDWLELKGKVARDVVTHIEQIDVLAGSRIGGDLEVHYSEDEERIVIDDSAEIAGEVRRVPDEPDSAMHLDRYSSADFYIYLVLSLAAAFVAGLVAYRLAPWLFSTIWRKPGDLLKPLGFGFVLIFAVPVGLLLIAVTIVGLPIALAGFATVALCLYLAKIVVAGMIGQTLLGKADKSSWREFALPLILGLGIVFTATSLPFVGGLVGFLTMLAGTGLIVLRVRDKAAL